MCHGRPLVGLVGVIWRQKDGIIVNRPDEEFRHLGNMQVVGQRMYKVLTEHETRERERERDEDGRQPGTRDDEEINTKEGQHKKKNKKH